MRKSDLQLLEESQGGSRTAFGAIIERYQSLVCAVALSAVGDVPLSEDVAQETFLTAWRKLDQLREPTRLRSWLCGIARNTGRNVRRRQAREKPLEHAVADRSGGSPVEVLLSLEERGLLSDALNGLPQTYREPLVLYYREGQSARDIGLSLDLSEDAVKQRLSRGRQRLQAQVARAVEATLTRTRPGQAFTAAVMAALPATAVPSTLAAATAVAAKGSAAAKSISLAGLLGAVLGPALGLLGAIIGTRESIVNTRSPRERRWMVRMAWAMWLYMLAFGAVELVGWLWLREAFITVAIQTTIGVVYTVGLIGLIVFAHIRGAKIRTEEGPAEPAPGAAGLRTPGSVYGALGGAIFGGLCWLVVLCGIAGHWALAATITSAGSLLLYLSASAALRRPERYTEIALRTMVIVFGIDLALLNLIWRDVPGVLPQWQANLLLVVTFGLVILAISRFRGGAGGDEG